jgi:hypothetical protein
MSPTHWGHSDDDLFDELRDAVRARRSVPTAYVEAARAAYTWRSIDAELASLTLTYDSAASEPEPVRGADTGPPRVLVFESGDLSVHLEVLPHVVTGQLMPPRAGRISLEASHGVVCRAEVEDDGFFVMARPADVPVRLALVADDSMVTDWLHF